MNLAEYKHIPLHDKFEMERNESLIARFRYLRYGNCNFQAFKRILPSAILSSTLVSSIITPCAALHLISLLSRSPSLSFWGPVLDLLRSYTASANRSVRGGDCFLQLGQIWHYWILSASTLFPQVPTKKAKLKESLLQIMDDEEDPLDKYLVRNLSLPPNHHLLKLSLADFLTLYSALCYRPS